MGVTMYLVCIPWKCIRSFYGRGKNEEVKEERRKEDGSGSGSGSESPSPPGFPPPKRRFASNARFIDKYLLRGVVGPRGWAGQLCSILLGDVCERESSWDVG